MSGGLTSFTCFSTIIHTINRVVSRGIGCDEFVRCGNIIRPDSTEWDVLGYPWANSSLLCSTKDIQIRTRLIVSSGAFGMVLARDQENGQP
jgi:hypothetical protein